MPASEFQKWAKSHTLTAWQAYKCCIYGRNAATRACSELADYLQNLQGQFGNHVAEAKPLMPAIPWGLILRALTVGPGKVNPTGNLTPLSGPVSVWGIAVESENRVGLFYGPEDGDDLFPGKVVTDQVVDGAEMALRAFARQTRKTAPDDCQACIRKRVLSQSKARVRASLEAWKPGIKDKRLMLRTPHK